MTPHAPVTSLARILAKTAVFVVVLQLALFYLRLGWFWTPVWAAGGVVAVLLAFPEIRAFRPSFVAAAFALAAYLGSFAALDALLFEQRREVTFAMTWQDRGTNNAHGQPEVVLDFVRFPGNAVGIYSSEVRDYLAASGSDTVPVTFRVTRDLGCLRGFSERRIGTLERWRSAFSYSRRTGDAPAAPGPDPWWCP